MRNPVKDILGEGGPIAERIGPSYEARPEQTTMAAAVARTLATKSKLIVEAGTGVGKSFAYLVPAITRCVAHGERVVIATHTINLQEQLLKKDIPLLAETIERWGLDNKNCVALSPVLVKGRGNYVSIRRLSMASKRQHTIFPDAAEKRSLHVIEDWAYTTTEGSLQTLPAVERPGIWDRVQSDTDNCMGRKCPTFKSCFYQKSREAIEMGNLLICNHAVFFADLKLRELGAGFLPAYNHVIFDEAHNLEEVASEHFGLSLGEGRVEHYLRTLLDHATGKGYLAQLAISSGGPGEMLDSAMRAVSRVQDHSRALFDHLLSLVRSEKYPSGRLPAGEVIATELPGALKTLGLALKNLREHIKGEEDRFELNGYATRAEALAFDAEVLTGQKQAGCVYWIEGGGNAAEVGRMRGRVRIKLACAPIDVAPVLRQHLWSKDLGIVLTSATLATGNAPAGGPSSAAVSRAEIKPEKAEPRVVLDEEEGRPAIEVKAVRAGIGVSASVGGEATARACLRGGPAIADPFAHCMSRLGIESATTLQLGSPFDYASQAKIIVDLTVPDPRRGGGGGGGGSSRGSGARDGRSDWQRYAHALAERIAHHARATDGGAFVLFTSNALMNACATALEAMVLADRLPLLVQGRDGRPSQVLEKFRQDPRSVLLGAASFWQGVDVRGDGLRNVIITKLPFDPPDRPLVEARNDRIKARGGDPFREESIPRAILRFRQGFGRLIRSETDQGRVVILDPRVVGTGYGRLFIAALPPKIPLETVRPKLTVEEHDLEVFGY